MTYNVKNYLKEIYIPAAETHKGQNGRLLIIGGSHLFHAASLWALEVASRIVDLVHYSSTKENNEIVQKLKMDFRDGIIVPRSEIESYIDEDDVILIGPGMVRAKDSEITNHITHITNIKDIDNIKNEGVQTYHLTKYLLKKYPQKKWVIDAGALQMLDLEDIPTNAILTPHHKEFLGLESRIKNQELSVKIGKLKIEDRVDLFAKAYNCAVLLKGEKDIIVTPNHFEVIEGGNAGMTKGGSGDVLAGLVAALFCKNDAFISAVCASFINKKAGDELYEKKGLWFNASDLADQIPETMKGLLI